ncbi:MAG TPA: asparagine synthase (glutamine-hydrolyzing) [Burkholderiales bacterium]
MCGIVGYCRLTGAAPAPAPDVIERMTGALRHRGPDGAGAHHDAAVGLGHARLSIIDLEGGAQPLANEDKSVWITFNGEIFNHVELRRQLLGRGHRFRTHSDTETIVHAYEDLGTGCVDELNGDFAFALWDSRRRRLVLARDRMGVRPLYYTVRDGVLVFASEVKALLRFPGVEARLDPRALDQVFTFWFPLAPRTPWAGIHELPPGHRLIAENGRIALERWWKLDYPRADGRGPALDRRGEAAIAEELEALLIDATRIRLRADVPVGAYLSGGFDSSATTALARLFPGAGLRTFSVAFESAEFDESEHQRQVVAALRTDHTSVRCTRADIASRFPDVIRHTERPVLRTAPAPLYLLSRHVRSSGFKVVVTGEGADEVLGGYDIFKEAKVRRFWARRPASRWRPLLLSRLYPYLEGVQRQPQAYLQAFFGTGLESVDDPLFSHLPRFRLTARAKAFFSADLRAELRGYDAMAELRESLPPEFARWHPLSQAQYLETAHLLPGYILSSQGDRVAMANAVEGRFPFLDHRVVELAARIPPRLKLKGLREKHILRRAVGKYLPAAIAERPKQPYRSPESECFTGAGAPEYARALLSPPALARSGLFDPAAVEKLASKCDRGAARIGIGDNMALVGILSTQLLDDQFAAGVPARAPDAAATVFA